MMKLGVKTVTWDAKFMSVLGVYHFSLVHFVLKFYLKLGWNLFENKLFWGTYFGSPSGLDLKMLWCWSRCNAQTKPHTS